MRQYNQYNDQQEYQQENTNYVLWTCGTNKTSPHLMCGCAVSSSDMRFAALIEKK